MSEENQVESEEVVKPEPKPAARLCKGQMPSPLVWFIKFKEPQDNRSAIAAKYFTTSGKVTDIQTNSNQKYIVESMTFTSEELDLAAEKIRENFVRGQDEDARGIAVSPRQLATTNEGDEEYALSVIETIREMVVEEDAVTLEQARAAHNEANPRAKKAEAEGSEPDPVDDAPLDDGEDDLLEDDDDLLD